MVCRAPRRKRNDHKGTEMGMDLRSFSRAYRAEAGANDALARSYCMDAIVSDAKTACSAAVQRLCRSGPQAARLGINGCNGGTMVVRAA